MCTRQYYLDTTARGAALNSGRPAGGIYSLLRDACVRPSSVSPVIISAALYLTLTAVQADVEAMQAPNGAKKTTIRVNGNGGAEPITPLTPCEQQRA